MPSKAKNYSKALIYKICCLDTNVKEIYVGSTTDIIRRRYTHKSSCNNPNGEKYNLKVYQHIRAFGGWTNWKMVLVEYFPCETELELGRREDYFKQKLKAQLNSISPHIYENSQEYRAEYREANRERLAEQANEYYEANKEDILEYHRYWYEANKEKQTEKKKDYYEANKEDIAEQTKKYRDANKEQIAEKKNQKHNCECGIEYTHSNKARHEKSNIHQKYLAEKTK